MKSLRFLLPGLLLALLLTTFQSFAASTRETRTVAPFTAVGLGGPMQVIFRQGSPQKVEVEGDAEDLAHLETIVEDGQLRINTKRENRLINSYSFRSKVTIYVTAPTVTALSVGGSGSLRAADPIRAGKLRLAVAGSGSLQLAGVTADELSSSVSGSGSLKVGGGSVASQQISISGSGGVQADQLQSKTCNVRVAGSGSCRVQATETLDARLAGSGSVYVRGNPRVSSSTAGSGRVHKL
ncbi:head GIN domain-containing protein [Hymenobacter actinosclerus]|uniref:Putative auto-transporter adhesin, head GIN domain n=1 Tax=Hymenobacter actinosclerus TaxID=82805 RepID=A0A1H9Z3V4_9BACT|nr:head GIN domain-containing protein [Hymenobacter actinosclerus]SES75546.1 Putative auto-transporter adhesin, head GIN domain [Hymenobacter actinosclerus]